MAVERKGQRVRAPQTGRRHGSRPGGGRARLWLWSPLQGFARRHLSTRHQRIRTLKRGAAWVGVCWAVALAGWFLLYMEPHRVVERLFLENLMGELVKGSEEKNLMLDTLGPSRQVDPREKARLREQLKRQFGR